MKKITLLIIGLVSLQLQAQLNDFITGLSNPVGITIDGNTMYTGSIGTSNIQSIDLSAMNPVAQDVITNISFPSKFVVIGTDLYFTYQLSSVGKIDLTSPTPTVIPVLTGLNSAFGLAVKDNFMYISNRQFDNGGIQRFDYTDSNPSTTLETIVSGISGFVNDIAIKDNELFLANSGENVVSKIDLTVSNPVVIDVVDAPGVLDVAFDGNFMYFSNGYLSRIDITNSTAQTEVLIFNTTAIWDITFDGSDIYLAQQTAGKISTANTQSLSPIVFSNNEFAIDQVFGTNLPVVSQGGSALADVDGDNDLDVFITGNNFGTYIAKLYLNDGNGTFSESTINNFEGVSLSSVAFADIDGDNDLDLMYLGFDNTFSRITKLYLNDGSGIYSEDLTNTFIGITNGAITFGDIDGDNDQDLFLSGEIGATGYTELFLNDGNGIFSSAPASPFTSVSSSTVDLADVDNDNDLDVLITGFEPSGQTNIANLYSNDGSGNYSLVNNTNFTGVVRGSVKFSDLDNDTDIDVVIAGQIDNNNFTSISRVYKNDGLGNFSADFSNNLLGVQNGSIDVADIDEDGDIDLIIGGESINLPQIDYNFNLYLNNGNGQFINDNLFITEGVSDMGFDIFGDIDNDGDEDIFLFSTDPMSGQSQTFVFRNVPAVPAGEKQALLEFYEFTNGNDWSLQNNWNTRFTAGQWLGVSTVNINDELFVSGIELQNNNLTGSIPSSIGNLNQLEAFNIFNNNVTGDLPSSIWNLNNLKRLLPGGQLDQQLNIPNGIPASIINLQDLEWLNVSGINLTNGLPSELFTLPNLDILRIASCGLSGNLPDGLANIRDVVALNNSFEGPINANFQSTPSNFRLNITNNLFDFSDLEALVQANNYEILTYSPQRTSDAEQNIEEGVGSNITLTVTADDINRTTENSAQNNEFQWFKDSSPINGAIADSYQIISAQVSDSGVYYCEITNPLVPDLTINRAPITLVIEESLGTTSTESEEVKLYPNPVTNWMTISLDNVNAKGTFKIIDSLGRLIHKAELLNAKTLFNAEHLNAGLYFLSVESMNYTQTIRFIKR